MAEHVYLTIRYVKSACGLHDHPFSYCIIYNQFYHSTFSQAIVAFSAKHH